MAADFGSPVAQNVDVNPTKGLQTLSDLVNLRQRQQTLDTGAFTQASAKAKATIDTQAAQENQNLAKVLDDPVSSGVVDKDGNPTVSGQSIVMKAAPTTGADAYGKIVDAARKKIEFNSAVNNLSIQERQEVGSTIAGAAAGAQGPQDIQAAIESLLASKKGTSAYADYKRIGDASMQIVNNAPQLAKLHGVPVPAGQDPWPLQQHAALGVGRQVLGVADIVGAAGVGTPLRGTMSSGATQQPGTFAPALQGGAFTPSGPATQNQIPPGYTLVNGQLVRADNSGLSLPPVRSSAPAPATGAKLPAIPTPGINANPGDVARYNATMEESRKHTQDVSAAANDLQNGVGPTRYRNDQIQDILNSKTFSPTGPGAAQLNWISSKIPGQSGDAFQKIGHYLAQNSAAIAQKMGVPGTNMGSEQAAAASGNTSQNRGALLEITKVNDAMNTALDMYNRGLAKVSSNGADPGKVAAYRQAFGQNFDMNVLRYDDALRRNDKAEIDKIKQEAGPNGLKVMGAKRKVLHSLADTGDLP